MSERPITLPPDLEWYEELGGEQTGWVCDPNGLGWWHVEELNLEMALPRANDGEVTNTTCRENTKGETT